MAKPVLIDTDILIDADRGIAEAVNCLRAAKASSSLATSIITKMELIIDCRNKSELRTVEDFLKQFHIVNLDTVISDKAVELLSQ